LRDVHAMAGHSSLQMTSRDIEMDSKAQWQLLCRVHIVFGPKTSTGTFAMSGIGAEPHADGLVVVARRYK
jgi:hypothetical protein